MVEFTSTLQSVPLGTSSTPFQPSVNPNEPYWKLINTHECFKVHTITLFINSFRLSVKTVQYTRNPSNNSRLLKWGRQNHLNRQGCW
jgi:hypothetical protein